MAENDRDEFVELARRIPRPGTWGRRGKAGTRYVRTPEGAEKYGLPIGSPITRDAIERANRRGRNYNVPEDSGDFGSTPPNAGRTRKTAAEMVTAIRNSPAPRRANPEGPKKVAVGNAGYGFPEGSRTFRPRDHENFAIVRTPDHELYVVTDKGVAFELDGELERELNEELDDDASENFDADEPRDPNALEDVDGDGETGESEDLGARPARVEDSPGFLSEDRIQDILTGMEQSGLDQNTRDMTELQLRRNNDRIRQEYAAAATPESDASGGGDDTTPPRTATDAPDDNPDRSRSEEERVEDLVSEIDREAQEAIDEGFAESEETPRAQRASARPRTERATPARTREAQATPSRRRAQRSNRRTIAEENARLYRERSSEASETDVETQLQSLEELARERPSGVAEGPVGETNLSVRRNRVNGEMEYFSENENFSTREAAIEHARSVQREARDTSDLSPDELTDEELTNLQADLNDFIESREFPPRRVLRRKREIDAELARRNGDEETTTEPESAPEPQVEETTEVPDGSPNDGTFNDYADPEDIMAARPGDSFVVSTPSGVRRTFVVGPDGRVRRNSEPMDDGIELEEFRDWIAETEYDVWANTSNRENRTPRPRRESGDTASRSWVREEAQEGAVAYTPDGIIAERTEDGRWETPLGRVGDEFFDSGDVEGDVQGTIVRTEPDADFRPPGASNELTSLEDLDEVRTGDGVSFVGEDGNVRAHATRRSDGTLRVQRDDGLHFDVPMDEGMFDSETIRVWHVPNQDLGGTPSRETWASGDRIRSVEDLNSLPVGTRLRERDGENTYYHTIEADGQMRSDTWPEGSTAGIGLLNDSAVAGRLTVESVPDRELTPDELEDRREALEPRVVENVADYEVGDAISSYQHLQDLPAGTRMTLRVTAEQNGGQSFHVPLVRSDDENTLGGFMFLVGDGGRGYNSFGENREDLYLAISQDRLLYGDITKLSGTDRERIEGDWDTTRNIELWEGGPKASEADLRQYIAAQMTSQAMQISYFDAEMLSENNIFRSQDLRNTFAQKAMEKYSTPDNPMRAKPASIRHAAKLLGFEFTDPESAEIADNIVPDDYRRRVSIGRIWSSTGNPYEGSTMGSEQIEVTAADIKNALAILDNVQMSESREDPDKILKRVFARQGSPLQDMNVALAVASYFRMNRRFEDGFVDTTHPARQNDKRRNRELLRQMLLEQLEGREPGYYGIPEDENYEVTHGNSSRRGQMATNFSTLTRPEINSDNDDSRDVSTSPAPPATPEPVTAPEPTSDPENVSPAPEPTPTEISETRTSLDDFDTVEEAYARSVQEGTASEYIEEVLGEPGLAAMNDGSVTLRDQFVRAWNQRNTEEATEAPDTPELLSDGDLQALGGGERVIAIAPDGTEIVMQRSGGRLVTDDGRRIDFNSDSRFYGMTRYRDRGWTFRRATAEEAQASAPTTDDSETSVEAPASGFQTGAELRSGDLSQLPSGSQIQYTRRDGRISTYTRDDSGIWRTNGGTETNPESWQRARFTLSHQPTGATASTSPVNTSPAGEITDADELTSLPEGTRIVVELNTGSRVNAVATTNDNGDPVFAYDDSRHGTGAQRGPGFAQALLDLGFRFHRVSGEPGSNNSGRQPGDTFRGSDIQSIPVGAHIRGESGRDYTVTETGILPTDSYSEFSFQGVENLNANFTYLGDSRPEAATPETDSRVGTWVSPTDMRSYPDGGYFQARSGLIWRRRGSRLRSTRSNQSRYIHNLSGEFKYLGENPDIANQPQRVATPAAPVQTLEEAGLSRVPREDIERYDQPRPVPDVPFDRENTTHWSEYLSTTEGQHELRQVIASALPEGSRVSVHASGTTFTASYVTPDGGNGEMTRTMRGDRRIENQVARASGAHFAAVQDNLFAFYRQHGIEEIEVHGLSGRNWNGAHTWIRRGFRPDPEREGANLNALSTLQNRLDGVIARIQAGRERQWAEFLEEAQDLSRRMTDLLNNRRNTQLDERMEDLYQIWRDLTYLGEVRSADGRTARGNRQSIGWALLGNRSNELWYYGIRSLNDYFEN